ncbi:MAG: TolC family protein [Elusimicrobia bacterium]|nr:TolC family protein [Elusimicrobiota bacterium]
MESLLEKNQVESKFTLQQPLFTGLKEFSAYAGFKKQETRDEWRLRQAELQLYDEVSRAYFDVVALESALVNNATSVTLSQDRLAELKSFYRLGKSREGEIFSAESQLAALKAIQVHLKGQIRVARETLSFLAGQDLGSASLILGPKETPEPVTLYLNQSARRPDVRPSGKKCWPKPCESVTRKAPIGPAPTCRKLLHPTPRLFMTPSMGRDVELGRSALPGRHGESARG